LGKVEEADAGLHEWIFCSTIFCFFYWNVFLNVTGWRCGLRFEISLTAPLSVYRDELLIPEYKDITAFL
jgi:hypothetical protein